jgi:lysyl-tRNA synthetase class 2
MTEQESDLKAQMRSKLDALKARGLNPYDKYSFDRTHGSKQIAEEFADIGPEKSETTVKVAGRIMAVRVHGKAGFADLVDRDGKVQLYFKLNEIGQERWDLFASIDRGDILGVTGQVFRTKMGEVTVAVTDFDILSKALIPYPGTARGTST